VIGPGGEGTKLHQGGFSFGQGRIDKEDFRQVLRLAGVDMVTFIGAEFSSQRIEHTLRRHAKGAGDVSNAEAGANALCLARRNVFAWRREPGRDWFVWHALLPFLSLASNVCPGNHRAAPE
jgi:hypothetical protein